jgi:acyl transferase domain-containing protein
MHASLFAHARDNHVYKWCHGCAAGSTRPHSTETQGNLGHLESAAGLAGLVKVLLMARHRLLLPSGSFSKWSPKIDAAALNLRVVTEVEPLVLPPGSPAFIGINSFGGLRKQTAHTK